MKQSAVRTLGVAALGAAFAATGAGVASAAPALPVAGQALDNASRALPAEKISRALPDAGDPLGQEQRAADADPAAQKQPVTAGLTKSANKLLGGLPVNGPSTDSLQLSGRSVL
jgi:hypothetical protein